MKHFEYDWDLYPDKIILDEELNINKLGWKNGDCFKVTNVNGRAMLVKLDPLEQFVKGYPVNVQKD